MVHIRTIKEAAEWLRAEDPNTCLTETAIRRLVRSKRILHTKVGKKYLVTLESLEAYLQGNTQESFSDEILANPWRIR